MVVDGIEILVRHRRVKYIRLTVNREGQVLLVIPLSKTVDDGLAFAKTKIDWIRKCLNRRETQQEHAQPLTQQDVDALVVYMRDAVERWRLQMGIPRVAWCIKALHASWGICHPHTTPARITFSIYLARVPHHLVDFIIVHELAHIVHPNHGAEFHDFVARFIPDESVRSKQLALYSPT